MSAEEVTTMLSADFEMEMEAGDPLAAQQEKQMQMYSRMRWGRVHPRPTKHTKAMQAIDEKVEKMILEDSVSVSRTVRVSVDKVQWILKVEHPQPMVTVTICSEPSCTCTWFLKLENHADPKKHRYQACAHIKWIFVTLLHITYTSELIDAPTLSSAELHDLLH